MRLNTLRMVVAAALWVVSSVAVAQQPPQLPDLGDTQLKLSWQDFKDLVERIYVPPTPPPAPPKEAFLRAAEYSGRLDPGVLSLDATVRLEVLASGWVKLPLWSDGAVVAFSGEGVLLNRSGSVVEAIAQGPGSYTLRARLAFAASANPGENRISLRLPDAPLNVLAVQAGEGIDDLEVEAGLEYRQQDGRIFVALSGGAATMRYNLPFTRVEDEVGEEVELEPRVLATAYQLLNLGEGVVSGALVYDAQVRVAGVDHFDLVLEHGVEVFDTTAPGLESWKILQRDAERVLRVKLAAPTEGTVRVVVSFEGAYDPEVGEVVVPRFRPEGVEREAGFVAVAADGAEVQLELDGNLLPADVSEIPADVHGWGGNLVAAYKYSGAPARASVRVTEHEDAAVLVAIIERLNGTTVLLDNGVEASWIDLVVKNNRKQFLKLGLPADQVEIWSLLVDGEPARPKHTGSEVLVPLPTSATEVTARISLVLLRRGEAFGSLSGVAPFLPRFDVPVSEAVWSVYLPADRLYSVDEGLFSVVEETAALRPKRRAGLGAIGVGMARSAEMAMPSSVSREALTEQKKQEEQVQQQIKARQTATRKGALPVRISLPGGISSMAKITVARILMVDEDETRLPIRTWPRWIRALGRWLQLALVLGAGLFFGLLAGRRMDRRFLRWAIVVLLAALVPLGGFGLAGVFFTAVLVAFAVWIVCAISNRRRRKQEIAEPPPLP